MKIGKPSMSVNSGKRSVPSQKDEEYFKDFGKTEMPFGQPDSSYPRIEIVGKVRTYGLRTLSYKLLADKYREYR
jgi:hypothetical protein